MCTYVYLVSLSANKMVALLGYTVSNVSFGAASLIDAKKLRKGAPRFELGTSRSAVECSTTELYPHLYIHCLVDFSLVYNIMQQLMLRRIILKPELSLCHERY